jgi:hypothetical protein
LVALGSPPKNRVVVDDERTAAFVLLEEERGGESADSAADGDEVVDLAGVREARDTRFQAPIAIAWPTFRMSQVFAVRVAVVADAPVTVERAGWRDRGRLIVGERPALARRHR